MAISIRAARFAPQFKISISTIILNVLNRIKMQSSRHRLSQLDAKALRDIGLSQAEANREAQKPIWDAPNHWLK
ncbi:MAG: DUF1127 domain-containing protein [Marinovum sp.]|nr:DUF1127 domain-containing protein [Marinovum sp.]MBT7908614.1 DUF1127 domain-containing protein [Marinovum sp.]